MAAQTFMQACLVGGEVSPDFYGRVDLAAYMKSLKTCRGFIVKPSGGVVNRAGTRLVNTTRYTDRYSILIPFTYSNQQTFVLEFSHYCMRVFTQGGQMILQPSTIAAITAYAAGTTYGLADYCSYNGVYYYSKVAGNIGHQPDTSPTYWLALTPSGSSALVEIPTPWSETDLFTLKYTQSADVLTICHTGYTPYNVSRLASDKWTCQPIPIQLGPFEDVNEDTTQNVYSSAAAGTSVTLTANVALFKSTDVGRLFYIEQQDAGKSWVSNTAMSLNEIRRSLGNYYLALAAGTTGYDPPQVDKNKWNDGGVNWQFLHPGFGVAQITGLANAAAYAAGTTYAQWDECLYGGVNYVSLQAGNTGHQPDTSPAWWAVATTRKLATASVIVRIPDAHIGAGSGSYLWAKGAWCSENGYPGCTTYHQQRQVFAGSVGGPQNIWLSKVGDFVNFGRSAIVKASDALNYPLEGRLVSAIKHVMTMGSHLVALSSDSEWSLSAPSGGALTQTDVVAKLQGYRGCSDVPPIIVGDMAIYVQAKGQIVRDLGYDYLKDVFTGVDLTRFAMHLVENHMIIGWAYQQNPFSTIWCVRDDGVLLSLTYVKDQEVMGWAWHDTDGIVESICCVSEGQEDAVYLVVNRTINGSTVRYVERMANRQLTGDVMSSCFLDCALAFDGTNYGSTTITASEPTGVWDENTVVTLNASANVFNASTDINDEIVFDAEGGRYNIKIIQVDSATLAYGVPQKIVGAAFRDTATTNWAWARIDFTGATALAGKTVGVYAEGYAQVPTTVDATGKFSISTPAVRLIIGLPYVSDIETLDLAAPNGAPLQDKIKNIPQVVVQLEGSRGMKVGGSFDSLIELKQSAYYDAPPDDFTGPAAVNIDSLWSTGGHVCIRQDYPLPLSIQAIVPQVQFAQR